MIRRPPRSTQSRSSAASDVYKRQATVSSPARSPRPALVWRLRVITVGHQSQRCPPAAMSGLSALGLMAPVLQTQADADPGEGGMVADSASPETCRPRTPTTTEGAAARAAALADVALAALVV